MMALTSANQFPCPVCATPQAVRITKKDKPYITCNSCGVQVFVRGRLGIDEFNRLVERARQEGLLSRLSEMVRRYRLTCPQCAHQFWVEPSLIKTSFFDGSLKGVRCPAPDCDAVLPWEKAS